MSSFIARYGNQSRRHDSLYSNISDLSEMIDYDNHYQKSTLFKINEEENSEDTVFDTILDCYSEYDDKRKGLQFPPLSQLRSLNNFIKLPSEYPKRKSTYTPESSTPIQISTFFRTGFDIINDTKNFKSRINTWKLKQAYRQKIAKNIFCSGLQEEQELHNELMDGTLTIFYRFESWNNYNGLFGGYKNKKGNVFIFYMYPDKLNMFIDLMSEDLNKHYLKYLKSFKQEIIGNIYYKEKFSIKESVNTKQDFFTLVEDAKDGFLLRNFV
jgi:hypothetical protein